MKPTKTKPNIAKEVSARILELMEQDGLPPWEKSWTETPFQWPRNALTGHRYRGINYWLTMLTQQKAYYDDPRWLTYRQAESKQGHVKKGEKGTQVVFWKFSDADPAEPAEPENPPPNLKAKKKESRVFARAYTVFNLSQTENCAIAPLPAMEPALNPTDSADAAAAIVAAMPQRPEIRHFQQLNMPPCYITEKDLVQAPGPDRYASAAAYYTTVFHELVHSTGHPNRLNRFKLDDAGKATPAISVSSHDYGQEEMVAGMGSAMLCTLAGLQLETEKRNASYIQHWRKAIEADHNMVLRAAQLAQKAVDFITGEAAADQDAGEPAADQDAGEPAADQDAGEPAADQDAGEPAADQDATAPLEPSRAAA